MFIFYIWIQINVFIGKECCILQTILKKNTFCSYRENFLYLILLLGTKVSKLDISITTSVIKDGYKAGHLQSFAKLVDDLLKNLFCDKNNFGKIKLSIPDINERHWINVNDDDSEILFNQVIKRNIIYTNWKK